MKVFPEPLTKFELLIKTNAEIVLSSDWKIMYNNDLSVLDELFKFNGVIKSPFDVTPHIGRDRQKEIDNYLLDNKGKFNQFVILDDVEIVSYPFNFIRCNIYEGLKQKGIKEKVLFIFNS